MIDHPGFLAAILADPASDFDRVVFADWLEDNGDTKRATFIRHQLAGRKPSIVPKSAWLWLRVPFITWFVRCPEEDWDDGSVALELSPTRHGSPEVRVVFRRGFAESVHCPTAVWLEHGPRLAGAAPLTRVELSDKEPLRHDHRPEFYLWLLGPQKNKVSRSQTNEIPWMWWPVFRRVTKKINNWRIHVTRQEAHDVLSAVALQWAKETPVEATQ